MYGLCMGFGVHTALFGLIQLGSVTATEGFKRVCVHARARSLDRIPVSWENGDPPKWGPGVPIFPGIWGPGSPLS